MDRRGPGPSARARPWLASLAVVLLAACQQGFPLLSQGPEPAGPGWRVVERLGEARYLAPSMAGWDEVVPGGMIPAGSQIATGIGGRLIVNHAGSQLSAGTGSRFILPGWEPGVSMRQTAGRLRYRIDSARPAEFAIETPFLEVLVGDAVLDVTVGDSATEVAVVSGRVRLKTLDGQRQIDLDAGYSGYASLQGDPLAVRRGPNGDLEKVLPTVLPALHPDRTADPVPETMPVAGPPPAPAAIASPDPQGAAPPAATTPAVAERSMIPAIAASPEVVPVPAPAQSRPHRSYWEASTASQAPFERLTQGLLDGLRPAQPAQAQPEPR
jgi:hypothetical protein